MAECNIVFTTSKDGFSQLHVLEIFVSQKASRCEEANCQTKSPNVVSLVSCENRHLKNVSLVYVSEYNTRRGQMSVVVVATYECNGRDSGFTNLKLDA